MIKVSKIYDKQITLNEIFNLRQKVSYQNSRTFNDINTQSLETFIQYITNGDRNRITAINVFHQISQQAKLRFE